MLALLKILIKRIQVAGLLIAVLFLNACSDGDKNSSLIFEELNESLERSNKAIDAITMASFKSLEEKTKKVESAERASVWIIKADTINLKANTIIEFIEQLKSVSNKGNSEMWKSNQNKLYSKLKNFRKEILSIDSEINSEFEKKIPVFNTDFKEKFKDEYEFEQANFSNSNSAKVKSVLSKFENDVKISQSDLIMFCDLKCGVGCNLGINTITAIISGNSTHFKSGEDIVITAGLGSFSTVSKPQFFINDTFVESSGSGYIKYKMKVKGNTGKYKVPVKIEYINQDGMRTKVYDYVEYTVDK
jgi:GldM N-terminal domain